MFVFFWYSALMRPSSSSSIAYDGGLPHFTLCSFFFVFCLFTDLFMQVTLSEKKWILYIKMCMIYKQCNYSILLLLYDFEWENVEIKQTWNLKLSFFPSDVALNNWGGEAVPHQKAQVIAWRKTINFFRRHLGPVEMCRHDWVDESQWLLFALCVSENSFGQNIKKIYENNYGPRNNRPRK